MRRTVWVVTAGLLAAALVLSGCAAPAIAAGVTVAPARESVIPQAASPEIGLLEPAQGLTGSRGEGLAAYEGALEAIYSEVGPSVVIVRVSKPSQQASAQNLFPFFFSPQIPEDQAPAQQGSGSGFVWDEEGHIVTNNHVIDGASSIEVTFADGSTSAATIVGADPDSDLAVLALADLPALDLQPVELADSTELRVGQMAIAIGAPYGLDQSMTVGIVSALGRSLPVDSQALGATYSIPDVIQTDAPINPGNSGGVLLDAEGRLIGVTAAIVSASNSSAGVGFAIPSVIVAKVVPALISDGQYEHPRIGISGLALTPAIAEAMDLDRSQRGALIAEVAADGPADQAGLHGSDREVEIDGRRLLVGGDVITVIDGQPVESMEDLSSYLARYTEVGEAVAISFLREGESLTVQVTLDARPPNETETSEAKGAYLGISGTTLTPEIAAAMGLSHDQTGVLIGRLLQGGPADQAGLLGSYRTVEIHGSSLEIGGDIIVGVDVETVSSLEDLQRILHGHEPGDEVLVHIIRDGKPKEFLVTLGESTIQP